MIRTDIAVLSCNGGTVTRSDGPAQVLKVATVRGVYTLACRGSGEWV